MSLRRSRSVVLLVISVDAVSPCRQLGTSHMISLRLPLPLPLLQLVFPVVTVLSIVSHPHLHYTTKEQRLSSSSLFNSCV